MALQSRLFRNCSKLQACLLYDHSHITPGSKGDHVYRIQTALAWLDDADIDSEELKAITYGPSTAAAVLAYKQRRSIINRSYQTQADNIVGKMTIAAMDRELLPIDRTTKVVAISPQCEFLADLDGSAGESDSDAIA